MNKLIGIVVVGIGFLTILCADNKNTYLAKKAMQDGNFTKALNFAIKAYEIDNAKNQSDTNVTIAIDLNNIGYVYHRLQNYPKALEYYKAALQIKEKKYGKPHKGITISLNNIASVYDAMKEYKEAIKYYKRVLKEYEVLLEKDHAYQVITREDIASDYAKLKDYDHALEYYLEAVEIKERILPRTHPKLFETYKNIALISEVLNKKKISATYYMKILSLHQQRFGDDNGTKRLKEKIKLLDPKVKFTPVKKKTKEEALKEILLQMKQKESLPK